MLRENTYVDNLMCTGNSIESLITFKRQASKILEKGQFKIHKWESNVKGLESEGMENQSKILGHVWNKQEDTLLVPINKVDEMGKVSKNSILSQLARIYDPLGIISPTLVEGKRIFREACDEKKGGDAGISESLVKDYLSWMKQLRELKIPRSLVKEIRSVDAVNLHIFADASEKACCAVTIAVVEQGTSKVKGLLTSKSRISKRNTSIARLELVGGQMAANMAKNICRALKNWPVSSVHVWMDSMVALFWISSPWKQWKTFVANRVRKIAEIEHEIGIQWRYCPSSENLADLGSRGANIERMIQKKWLEGPNWLLNEEEWPHKPEFKSSTKTLEEQRQIKETFLFERERETDEWDELLERQSYWRTLRTTSWCLRFMRNCIAKKRKERLTKGPLTTEEINRARDHWIVREQGYFIEMKETPGWKLIKDEKTGIVKCLGRIQGYQPIYLERSPFTDKLIRHVHRQVMHMGVASTMGALRETWWIPKMRTMVKKEIRNCNVCKVFAAKPFDAPETAALPTFRTVQSLPFQYTGVDFIGPLKCKGIGGKEDIKVSVIIFTCAVMRGVHLEVTRTQTAEEFQRKLNAFITRKTRPEVIVSDNASVFKTTAEWIKKIRKSEKLQDHLASLGITWRFNLSKSPWWGAMYERLIRDLKRTLYKTLGKTHLKFEQLEAVVMDIKRHLNNRPLTYVESESGEEQVLTPNIIMWGKDSQTFEDIEVDEDKATRMYKRLKNAREHVWSRWSKEYITSLMEVHRINRKKSPRLPEIGEVVLIVGDERNKGQWKKARVEELLKGRDSVVRGVILRYKGHLIERPIQAVCPLEIRCQVEKSLIAETAKGRADCKHREVTRVKRRAALDAEEKTKLCFKDN